MSLVVLTGASGSGKTVIARSFAARYPDVADTLFFDSIGVPSRDEMIRQFGSGEEWQRSMTMEWMRDIGTRLATRSILFEGQMRLSFIHEAAQAANISDYLVVLVDCDDATRRHRLIHERGQPDLATADMANWARYLREEAQASNARVIDTTGLSPIDAVEIVREMF